MAKPGVSGAGSNETHERVYSDNKQRSLGVDPPKRRVDLFLLKEKKRLEKEGFCSEEITALAEAGLSEKLVRDKRLLKEWIATAPISRAVLRNGISRLLEAGAALRIPEIAWLKEWMTTHDGSGRRAAEVGISTIFSIALEGGPPNFSRRFEAFEGSGALRSFLYDFPSTSKLKAAYLAWHSAAKRREPDAVAHGAIALLRQLADIVEDPDNPNQMKVGQYLMVDGTHQQANIAQRGASDEEESALIRGDYQGTAYMKNVRSDGTISKETNGYNLIALVDMATSLPVIWFSYPANYDEREAAEELLEMLFFIWPDCPAEYLIGDAYFDHSVKLARNLERKWNIHPIFHRHGSRSDTVSDYAATDGVPPCKHSGNGFMKRESDDNFFAGLHGAAKGSPRGGDPPNLSARIKWVCPTDECVPKRVTTRPHVDPRRHTYLPQQGDHWLYFHRLACLARRNGIESVFGVARTWFLFAGTPCRIGYAKTTNEACFAFGLAMLGFIARRLVHVNGLYEATKAQANALGLLEPATLDNPSPGPTPQQLAAAREWLPMDPQPPQSWLDR